MSKKTFVIGAVVVIAFAVISTVIIKTNGNAVFASGGINVKTETVKKQDIVSSISASGVIEEVEKADVYFDTALKVKKLLVKKDDKVVKGQKLIEFDMDSLNSEYEQLKLNRDIQELSLRKIRETGSTQNVNALELSMQQASENLVMDTRNLDQAKKDLERGKVLHAAAVIPDIEYEKYEKAYQDAESRMKITSTNCELAKSNLENARNSDGIDVSSQEKQLKLKNIAVADMEKTIAKITENSIAPMEGVVTAMSVNEGEIVKTAEPVFTISGNDKFQIKANVKEYDIKNVKLGQRVDIRGDGIDESVNLKGKVIVIAPSAQKVENTSGEETVIGITVVIDGDYPNLKPGLTVACKVITGSQFNVPVAKYSMLLDDSGDLKTVFLCSKDGIARKVNVQTGITSDLNVEITDGLKGGENVILNPPNTLQDGMKVKTDSN